MSVAQAETAAVVRVFESAAEARDAVLALKRMGFQESQIGIVSSEMDQIENHLLESINSMENKALTGIATGLSVGALWGLGILAGFVPGIGPAIAGGALGVVISNAVVGAVTGGLAATLISLGVPKDEAEHYEDQLRSGHTIVSVIAGNRADTASYILSHCSDEQDAVE